MSHDAGHAPSRDHAFTPVESTELDLAILRGAMIALDRARLGLENEQKEIAALPVSHDEVARRWAAANAGLDDAVRRVQAAAGLLEGSLRRLQRQASGINE